MKSKRNWGFLLITLFPALCALFIFFGYGQSGAITVTSIETVLETVFSKFEWEFVSDLIENAFTVVSLPMPHIACQYVSYLCCIVLLKVLYSVLVWLPNTLYDMITKGLEI